MLACTVSIATCNLHQSQEEQRAVLYFEHANDNIHLSIDLLGLIVDGLQFSHENVLLIEYI